MCVGEGGGIGVLCNIVYFSLTLSTRQTQTGTFANSVDPDEMADNKPSHLELHCLSFCSYVLTDTLFAIIDLSKYKDVRVHFRNVGMKGLKYVTGNIRTPRRF